MNHGESERIASGSGKPGDTAGSTFRVVQAVRGLAACMVVVFHTTQIQIWSGAGTERQLGLWNNGNAGVDIFFVISGFVMAISSLGWGKGNGPDAARRFFERRLIRILPLYWLMTTIMLVLMKAQHAPPDGHAVVQTPLSYIVSSYLLIPYRNSVGGVSPLLLPGWTLIFEMFFYMWFATALWFRLNVPRFLTLVLGTLAIAGVFRRQTWPVATVLLDPILLEFLAGLLLARWIQAGGQINQWLSGGLGGGALLLLALRPSASADLAGLDRLEWWGVLGFLIVQAAVLLESPIGSKIPRWALLLGDASYSLYLSHIILIKLEGRALSYLHLSGSSLGSTGFGLLFVILTLMACIMLACLLYIWVERPLLYRLRNALDLRRPRQEALVTSR